MARIEFNIPDKLKEWFQSYCDKNNIPLTHMFLKPVIEQYGVPLSLFNDSVSSKKLLAMIDHVKHQQVTGEFKREAILELSEREDKVSYCLDKLVLLDLIYDEGQHNRDTEYLKDYYKDLSEDDINAYIFLYNEGLQKLQKQHRSSYVEKIAMMISAYPKNEAILKLFEQQKALLEGESNE